jgi:uncharacterized membrane protein
MPSSDAHRYTPRIFAAALLLSSALQIGESLLPRIPLFPWLRLGISWAILLPWLLSFGTLPALALFLLRNILALICGGQAASSFLLSGISGAASLLLLGPLVRFLVQRNWLGWAGAGALLAAGFNLAQLGTAADLMVGHSGLWSQVGPLLAWSGISGGIVGGLAFRFWRHRDWESLSRGLPDLPNGTLASRSRPLIAVLCVATIVAAFAVSSLEASWIVLSGAIPLGRQHLRSLKGAWPFFLWLGWLHLPAPGHLIDGLPLSQEGVTAFVLYSLRLVSFLLVGQELGRVLPWDKLTRGDAVWAKGLALALPCVVGIFPAALATAKAWRDPRPWDVHFWDNLRKQLEFTPVQASDQGTARKTA